jgi:uncharacterized protein (TIGR04206 family)
MSRWRSAADARLGAILALAVLPWSLVFANGELTLVFTFGLVDPRPLYLTDLITFVTVRTGGLPQFLLSWPIGVGIYLLAVASAASGVLFGREDRRVTAALLVLVGLTQLSMAWGFSRRIGTVALPLGTLLSWAVVWWFDWPALRGAATFRE